MSNKRAWSKAARIDECRRHNGDVFFQGFDATKGGKMICEAETFDKADTEMSAWWATQIKSRKRIA